ncbi:hypothetical protein INR49_011919 [Caranx melampygus]|nr:hypothetical protein INR49_011919 [Caranx melampygus]
MELLVSTAFCFLWRRVIENVQTTDVQSECDQMFGANVRSECDQMFGAGVTDVRSKCDQMFGAGVTRCSERV